MRFSLKWVLAGTVYVAIAAAAFGTGKWYFADALWALTLLAAIYAISVAMFASGKRRAIAATFVVGSLCFLLCVAFGSDSVPMERLVVASGVGQVVQAPTNQPPIVPPSYTIAPAPVWNSSNSGYAAPMVQLAPAAPQAGTIVAAPIYPTPVPLPAVNLRVYVRAANAVAALTFGLIGSLIGLAAFRTATRAPVE